MGNGKSKKQFKCLNCQTEQSTSNYYVSYDTRLSAGVIPYCKSCLQNMIVDDSGNINEDRLRQTLKLMNRPFIQELWNISKKDGRSEFGSYMKNLAMPQNRRLTWEDSIYDGFVKTITNISEDSNKKIYSKKWSGYYLQSEIDYLDDYLEGLNNDFKIITTNHKDYAKKIAQASLAVNKAYQDMLSGISGSDKRYKDLQATFDTLSKSAQFSENTRTATDSGITGIAQIVDKVETNEWIYDEEDFPKDALDHLLDQFSNINKSL